MKVAVRSSQTTQHLIANPSEWDQIVSDLDGHPQQRWAWGASKVRHGWTPERLLIRTDRHPLAAAQILFRQVGPFSVAYVPRGPAGRAVDPTVLEHFTTAMDYLCKSRRAAIVFMEPDAGSPFKPVMDQSNGWQRSPRYFQPLRTIKVRVDAPDDVLLERMKPKTRYWVRLARRRGVEVRRGTLADVPTLHALLQETKERHGAKATPHFRVRSPAYYHDLLEAFGDDGALFIAEFNGEPAAAILLIRFGKETIYLWGGSATAYKRHGASYLAQFEGMRWARAAGSMFYDLYGIPASDQPAEAAAEQGKDPTELPGLWGVYRFKRGFGGEIVEYGGVFERAYLAPLVRAWRLLRPHG